MTRKQMLNKELNIGDFVKFSAGSETSRKNIWMVVGIDYTNVETKGRALVRLRLVDGIFTEQVKGHDVQHEVGYERTLWSTKLIKIEVTIKEKV